MVKNSKGPAPKKGGGKKQKEEEFDVFLAELTAATAESSKHRKDPKTTAIENRQKIEAAKKIEAEKRQSEIERMILHHQKQQQLRNFIQQMLRSPFSSKPNTDYASQSAENSSYKACCGWMQGWRSSMEDAHIVLPDFNKEDKAGLFAVFDGHSGDKCAKMCQNVMPATCQKYYDHKSKTIDFETAYLELDESLRVKLSEGSGCTAVTVLVNDEKITCASVGDSRAVLCRADGTAVDLSQDHKPESPTERIRIEAAGGHVANNRVNGELAMSRALGDFQYKRNAKLSVEKQLVTPTPDVITYDREAGDRFFIVACDGIFDVLTNQEVVDFVKKELDANRPLEDICKEVCLHCLAPEVNGQPSRGAGTDNMTITIVLFK